MDNAKTGKTYGASVALATDKRKSKAKHTAAKRNPKGTAPDCIQCPYYHPRFCTVLGHTSDALNDCFMKFKTKDERKVILATLKKWQIDEELALQADGKSISDVHLVRIPIISHFSEKINIRD